jgi:hypothetical protein
MNQSITWLLSGSLNQVSKIRNEIVLVGPNVEFELEESLSSFLNRDQTYFLVPAKWVAPVLQARVGLDPKKIIVWAVGLNSQEWCPSERNKKTFLVYIKGSDPINLSLILQIISESYVPQTIRYGNYTPKKFYRILDSSAGAIWFGSTESQGIALMQAWSMDVPTLVRTNNEYLDPVTAMTFGASSSPYLTKETGSFFVNDASSEMVLRSFLKNLKSYTPRKNVLDNFEELNCLRNLIKELIILES